MLALYKITDFDFLIVTWIAWVISLQNGFSDFVAVFHRSHEVSDSDRLPIISLISETAARDVGRWRWVGVLWMEGQLDDIIKGHWFDILQSMTSNIDKVFSRVLVQLPSLPEIS
jgi:hypothetical protein